MKMSDITSSIAPIDVYVILKLNADGIPEVLAARLRQTHALEFLQECKALDSPAEDGKRKPLYWIEKVSVL